MVDRQYYQMQQSMTKALNGIEIPLKVKHARAIIIGTFQNQGAQVFWTIALRQPMMENRMSAWKFCHLLHKILREGHPLCCEHSKRNIKWLRDLGRLWGHLTDGYGNCILQYTKLLVHKIEFHLRNPRFPGNLAMHKEELDKLGGGDMNIVYQVCIETFDYLDELIALQDAIFNSLVTMRINSMTNTGQCRIAGLIPCIQDSNALYDIGVRLMFKLHANLPPDVLVGHRQRFNNIYGQLQNFYAQSKELQYFVGLVTVPILPAQIPNFSSSNDYGDYNTPVIIVEGSEAPTPEEVALMEEMQRNETAGNTVVEQNLVDTSVNVQAGIAVIQPEEQSQKDYYIELIKERDDLVQQLQTENAHLNSFIKTASATTRDNQEKSKVEIVNLQTSLLQTQAELLQLRKEKEEIAEKTQQISQSKDQLIEQAKSTDEKFSKFRTMYTQIREEHVKLLREHHEANRQLVETKVKVQEVEQEHQAMKTQIIEFEREKTKVEETLSQSVETVKSEKSDMQRVIEELQEERLQLLVKQENLDRDHSNKLDEAIENLKKLQKEHEQLKSNCQTIENAKQTMTSEINHLTDAKNDYELKLKNSATEIEEIKLEKSKLLQLTEENNSNNTTIIADITAQVTALKQECETTKSELEAEKGNLILQIAALTKAKEATEAQLQAALAQDVEHAVNIEKSNAEKAQLELEKEGLQSNITELQVTEKALQAQLSELETNKTKSEDALKTELLDLQQTLETEKAELSQHIETTKAEKEELENRERNYKIVVSELKAEIEQKIQEYAGHKVAQEDLIAQKDAEIGQITDKLNESEERCKQLNLKVDRLMCERTEVESELQDILHQQEQLFKTNADAQQTIQTLEESVLTAKIHGETCLKVLIETCIKASRQNVTKFSDDSETAAKVDPNIYFFVVTDELKDVLSQLEIVYEQYKTNNEHVDGLARKLIACGHLTTSTHHQALLICNKMPDIEAGDQMADKMQEWNKQVVELFDAILTRDDTQVQHKLNDIQLKLQEINKSFGELTNKPDSSARIEDLVEEELSTMDAKIEEAAAQIEEMLSKSRASDSGIKLEVNEKILDACTQLMRSIRTLVQKSRVLQNEIVSTGKGTATEKEFYKRNHQWTEGMISAAKNVAQGANFLVTAANKAVTGDAKQQFDLIVAAQEIAATTAQLVVASRVKAERGSTNLMALGSASKEVSKSTGAVVAIAKDSSQRLEDSQDLDLSTLTVHQAKTLEMQMQVRIMELQQSLEVERKKISALRKKTYVEEG